jgi:glutaredoxin
MTNGGSGMKQMPLHREIILLIFCAGMAAVLSSPRDSACVTKQNAMVRIDSLDVHAKASADSGIVKTLAKGEAVSVAYELVGMEGSWCAIKEDGKSTIAGYVPCRHLERGNTHTTYKAAGSTSNVSPPLAVLEETSTTPAVEIARPASDAKVKLYLAEWCPYCRKARECLKSSGVNLMEYDIEKDESKQKEMIQKGGTGGIPFIDIEGVIIRGYNEEAIKHAVAKRRGL